MSAPEVMLEEFVEFAIFTFPPTYKSFWIPTPPSTTNAPVCLEVELVVPVTRVSPIRVPSTLPVMRPEAVKDATDEFP